MRIRRRQKVERGGGCGSDESAAMWYSQGRGILASFHPLCWHDRLEWEGGTLNYNPLWDTAECKLKIIRAWVVSTSVLLLEYVWSCLCVGNRQTTSSSSLRYFCYAPHCHWLVKQLVEYPLILNKLWKLIRINRTVRFLCNLLFSI